MSPFAVGKKYGLRLPDGRILGHVQIREIADDWAEGSFRPTADFLPFRDLFDEEAQLRNDRVIPLWEEAADRIEALRIQAVGEDGQVNFPLRVFIEGDEAFLAPAEEPARGTPA
jgi:hypothetical protein